MAGRFRSGQSSQKVHNDPWKHQTAWGKRYKRQNPQERRQGVFKSNLINVDPLKRLCSKMLAIANHQRGEHLDVAMPQGFVERFNA